MDSYEILFHEIEDVFVIYKNDHVYAKFPNRRDVEHFLSILYGSIDAMDGFEMEEDVFNEDWSCLFFKIEYDKERGIILAPGPDYSLRWK